MFNLLPLRSLLALLWLLLLSAYILAGLPITPFHGDEAMQITMSADYDTAFIQRNLSALMVAPPYPIDSPAWLRLINGSVNRYLIGLSWHLTGFSVSDLPPIWQWPVSYDDNVAQGNRPPAALLTVSRWPSALLLCLSVIVMFGIGRALGGWSVAWLASGFYALHPVILINGRRAMQEGALLCFGLLSIWLVLHIARRLSGRKPVGLTWWIGLALAAALTLASKHSGIVFVAAAFGWAGIAIIRFTAEKQRNRAAEAIFQTTQVVRPVTTEINQLPSEKPLSIAVRGVPHSADTVAAPQDGEGLGRGFIALSPSASLLLCLSAVMSALLLFLALSPALWNDPPARLRDLLTERAALLDSQVVAAGGATPFPSRLNAILTQPFLQPVEIYEAGFWANSSAFMAEVRAYEGAAWAGLGGILPGLIGSGLALVGLGLLLVRLRAPEVGQRVMAWGMALWLLLTLATLLVNPLPWQRYYLPLLPITTLLAGWGGACLLRWLWGKLRPD